MNQNIKLSKDIPDLDLQQHLKELEKYHLKVTEW